MVKRFNWHIGREQEYPYDAPPSKRLLKQFIAGEFCKKA
ncbi:hypothetical protein Q31b_10010 [Novipirellula aureliae]|uniref:Uncharacterized protein n=1 Tax=Novipirellula aureliae TaxID=2527966 RepID=A0A5C6EBG5_9BACT|nr:hypothetical protein Q31b_10010 [Novipirellula aureliae]